MQKGFYRIVNFRDLAGDNIHGYIAFVPAEVSFIVKPMFLEGRGIYPSLYIQHFRFEFKGKLCLLITQCDYNVADEKLTAILSGAISELKKEDETN